MEQLIHALRTGDILVQSFGYERTYNRFGRIIRRTPHFAEIEYLTNVSVGLLNKESPVSGHELPGISIGETVKAKVSVFDGYECAKGWSRWDGRRRRFNHWD